MICDPFLRSLPAGELDEIEARRLAWHIDSAEFYARLDRWFANFGGQDKPLALKILLNVQYYNQRVLEERMQGLKVPVLQFLRETDRSWENVLLVLPDGIGDSADKHAYDLIKGWSIPEKQIIRAGALSKYAGPDRVVIFFNDTHGTGNQFLRQMLGTNAIDNFAAVFILAFTIGEKAIRRFKSEVKGVRLVPDCATPDARDIFSAAEFRRIREIGAKVYPTHPVGYGDGALLTAYYFQCPNNSLPLIWADGSNNVVDGKEYAWSPLFPYRPKVREARPASPAEGRAAVTASLLTTSTPWPWTADEIDLVERQIGTWGLVSDTFYETVGRWFANFSAEDKPLAFKVFCAIRYLNIDKNRAGIRELRKTILTNIKQAGGDVSDILLVTTGDHKNSVYHYEFEMMKGWGLSVDQVCSIKELSQDKVIDKTLVFFYHTRVSAGHFLKTHLASLQQLVPRTVVIAAYAMSETAKAEFKTALGDVVFACVGDVSESAVKRLGEPDASALDAICASSGVAVADGRAAFLAAYYFQCPQESHPALWSEAGSSVTARKWEPLFRHICPPA